MRTFVVILLILVTLAFGACAWLFYFDSPFLLVVQPGVLYRDGFSNMRRFENAYRQRPFKTVIDLRANDDPELKPEDLAAERAFCKQHGIAFNSLPMRGKTAPTPEQIKQFVELVGNSAGQPVLVHNSDGNFSVSMMAAVWQKEGMGYPYEQTLAAVSLFNAPESSELTNFIKHLYHKQ